MKEKITSYRDFRLWYLLNHATNALYKARDKELSQYGISVMQSAVLYLITDFGGKATIADIARALSKHPSTITRQVKLMEGSGLVIKEETEGNQQQMTFCLTEKGEKTYQETLKHDSIHEAMSLLSSIDRHQLELYLTKVWEKSVKQLR